MLRAWTIVAIAAGLGCEAPPSIHVELDRDAGADASRPTIPWDGGPPCESTCGSDDPCVEARCESGACVLRARDDGELCADDGSRVCVAHGCRDRGCGDGWREAGADPRFPREGCDLGAAPPGELCDAACAPRAGALVPDLAVLGEEDLAAAIDGEGTLLVLAVVRGKDVATLWALRFDGALHETRERVALATIPRTHAELTPAAAGLEGGGFAVAFVREPEGVVVGVIEAGSDAPPRWAALAPSATLAEPAIAALDRGFVVVATETASAPDDPDGGIRARRFDETGRALGAPVVVAEDRSGIERAPSVAASDGTWRVAWDAADALGARRSVRTRLFAGDRALEPERAVGAPGAAALGNDVIALDGAFALAWIEVGAAGVVARSELADAGSVEPGASIAADGAALAEPRGIALARGASALLCVERASLPRIRWSAPADAPPELALLDALPVAAARTVVADRDRVLFVWPAPDTGAVHALALPRS